MNGFLTRQHLRQTPRALIRHVTAALVGRNRRDIGGSTRGRVAIQVRSRQVTEVFCQGNALDQDAGRSCRALDALAVVGLIIGGVLKRRWRPSPFARRRSRRTRQGLLDDLLLLLLLFCRRLFHHGCVVVLQVLEGTSRQGCKRGDADVCAKFSKTEALIRKRLTYLSRNIPVDRWRHLLRKCFCHSTTPSPPACATRSLFLVLRTG